MRKTWHYPPDAYSLVKREVDVDQDLFLCRVAFRVSNEQNQQSRLGKVAGH